SPWAPAALHLQAGAHLRLDELNESREALKACIAKSPLAADCMDALNDLDSAQGKCQEAEESSRRLIASYPGVDRFYWDLARALYGEGEPLAGVRAVLEQGVSFTDATEQAATRAEVSFYVHVLAGEFSA